MLCMKTLHAYTAYKCMRAVWFSEWIIVTNDRNLKYSEQNSFRSIVNVHGLKECKGLNLTLGWLWLSSPRFFPRLINIWNLSLRLYWMNYRKNCGALVVVLQWNIIKPGLPVAAAADLSVGLSPLPQLQFMSPDSYLIVIPPIIINHFIGQIGFNALQRELQGCGKIFHFAGGFVESFKISSEAAC